MAPSRHLLSLIQKRFLNTTTSATFSPSSTSPSSSSFTVQYLINSCGLPLQSALSVSQKLHLNRNNLQKHQSVLGFLKSYDFNSTHIAKLIEKRPDVLLCGVEDNLKPKVDYLITYGFSGKLLPELIVSNPVILKRALDFQIKPSLELLKSVLDSNEKIVAAVRRSSWLLTFRFEKTIQPNIDFLIKEGVPFDNVTKMMLSQPRVLMQKHDRIVYAVNAVKNFGFEPKATMFMHALKVMIQMGESTWKKKIEVMKTLGWSEEEILWAYKKCPFFLSVSEEKIRRVMDFLVNSMKLSPQTIIETPLILTFSIDRRLRPRYNVLKVLELQKLIKGNAKIEWLLSMSEKKFLKTYVTKYVDQVPSLLEIYGGTEKVKG